MSETLKVDKRFCGPPSSANGGYIAGLLSTHLVPSDDEAVEVTLKAPIPFDVNLDIHEINGEVELRHVDLTVATARVVEFDLRAPTAPVDAAVLARSEISPLLVPATNHPAANCFVCGPAREVDDGMRLFPQRVSGTSNYQVSWTVSEHGDEFIWAALDCPSSLGMYLAEDPFFGPIVLGRITGQVRGVPLVGDVCDVVSWREGVDGRKMFGAAALFAADGECLAVARSTWIRVPQIS